MAFLGALMGAEAWASSPYTLSYGGRLVDASGAPQNGPVEVKIKFFDAASGGNQLGPEVDDQNVVLTNGVFQAPIVLDGAGFQQVFGGANQVFIQVTDVSHGQTYPAQAFSAVPYALRVPVDSTSITYDVNGNLTLTNPPGTTAGDLVQVQAGGKLPALDGSLISNITAQNITGLGPLAALAESGNANTFLRGDGIWSPLGFTPSGGNLGVGTTAPTATLDVEGTLKFGGGAPGTGKVLTSDGSGNASWQTLSGTTQWQTVGSNISFSAGSVSIGTTSALGTLQIRPTANENLLLGGPGDLAAGTSLASVNDAGSQPVPLEIIGSPLVLENPTGPLKVGIGTTSPVNAVDIAGAVAAGSYAGMPAPAGGLIVSGGVGIGTSTPASPLTVNGTIQSLAGGIKFPDGTTQVTAASGSNPNWGGLALDNVSALSIGTTTPGTDLFFGSGANRTLQVQTNAGGAGNSLTVQAGGGTGAAGGDLVLASGTSPSGSSAIELQTASGGAPVTSMTILGNGNVGIGTTSPSARLEVTGVVGAAPSLAGEFLSVIPDTTGIYGDTTTPGSGTAPDVAFSAFGKGYISGALSATYPNTYGVYLAGAPNTSGDSTFTNVIALGIDANNIAASGGTAQNSYGLLVNAQSGATNNYAAVFQGGNVGIGTTSPTGILDVEGGSAAASSSGGAIHIVAQSGNGGGTSGGSILLVPGVAGGSPTANGVPPVGNGVVQVVGPNCGGGQMGNSILQLFDYDGGYFRTDFGQAGCNGSTDWSWIQSEESSNPEALSLNPFGGNVGIGISVPPNTFAVSPVQYNAGSASQSGTTITGYSTSWTLSLVGDELVFANGISAGMITDVANATSLTVSTSQTVALQTYSINNIGLNVTSIGNVGIGTTSPTSTLEVNGSETIDGTNKLSFADGTFSIAADTSANGGSQTLNLRGGNPGAGGGIGFEGNSGSALAFFSAVTGNFGINTTNPVRKLQVVGDGTYAAAFTSGNVGIGTTSPGASLEVNGGIRINTSSSMPTCDASQRGTTWIQQGASGVTDTVYACLKSALDGYSWVTITTGG